MKKLLTLVAILPAVSLSVPCFGVDWVRDILLRHTVLAILVIVSVITTQTA